jgi:hypothetical protein
LIARAALYDFLAVLAASSVVIVGLLYAEVVYVFDLTTLLVSVVLPLTLGSAIFLVRKNRTLLFAFLAFFWAVVDDRPVFFDSVLTWPEVTRFHPFLPRLFMNIVIHALTILFLYLMIRELMKGSGVRLRNAPIVIILASVAFVLAYAQNIPLAAIQNVVEAGSNPASWYPFDIATKLTSIFFLCLTVWQATKLKAAKDQAGPAAPASTRHK